MNRRNLVWRLAGALLVGAAACTGLRQHRLPIPIAGQPPGPVELVLGLTGFALALVGMLLIINGPRLRDKWRGDLENNALSHRRDRVDRNRPVP